MIDKRQVMYDIERCVCHVPDACRDCSHYYGKVGFECMENLLTDARSVIESLQSEIKIITENNTEIDKQRGEIAVRFEKLRLENERLKENIDTLLPVLHGKWEEKEYSIGKCYAICSLCKKSSMGYAKDTGFGFEYSFPNYCPHCGAKMKDGENE